MKSCAICIVFRLVLAYMMFLFVACTGVTPESVSLSGTPTTPTTSPPQEGRAGEEPATVYSSLRWQTAQSLGDALGDGVLLQQASSLRHDPVAVLGAIYLRIAKPGYSCDAPEPEASELVTIPSIPRPIACTPTVSENPVVYVERIVKGEVDARLTFLVGEGAANASYAFELNISNLISAGYPNNQQCFDVESLATLPLPNRTCDITYVRGATVTHVVYRQYTEAKVAGHYNSLINIEGKLYGTSSKMQSQYILTGNLGTLRGWFSVDDEGYLKPNTPTEARRVATEVNALPDDRFIDMLALPSDESSLLPRLFDPNALPPELEILPAPPSAP